MSETRSPLHRYAAALQCVAQDFREHAVDPAGARGELARFADVLEHIAASLLVPQPMPRVVLAQTPALREGTRW